MAVSWKKVLLSGDVVNADINASAGIAVSKLAALTASRIVETDGSGFLTAVAKASAYNKAFGSVNDSVSRGDHNHDADYNDYTHPTTDGSKHVPATGTGNNDKVLKAGATAGVFSWQTNNLNDLGDIAAGSPAVGDVIIWNGGTWQNATLAGAGIATSGHSHDFSGSFHPLGGDLAVDFAVQNLTVAGTMTQTNVADLMVADKMVTLAYVNGGNGTPITGNGAGINVETSNDETEYPSLFWDSSAGWQIKQGYEIDGNTSKRMPTARSHATAVPSSVSGVFAGDTWFKVDTNDMYVAVGG